MLVKAATGESATIQRLVIDFSFWPVMEQLLSIATQISNASKIEGTLPKLIIKTVWKLILFQL